jgi:hypothetical protein
VWGLPHFPTYPLPPAAPRRRAHAAPA